ncbi:MAG: hypothetical protein HYV63_09940 [Candidatus Schekmanbacteria bacterium]|nr:hypothetical protein [Candidatus Schekmanbacteria bacterium]
MACPVVSCYRLRIGLLLVLSLGCAGESDSGRANPCLDLALEERAKLPAITQVETWRQNRVVGPEDAGAPSVVRLLSGDVRIFWNAPAAGGIASATSSDGWSFTDDPGLRVANGASDSLDALASHPWVVAAASGQTQGYRLYYQAKPAAQDSSFRIMSAWSANGLDFAKEGIRIDVGAETGLLHAAHGRAIQLDDGRFRMWFSASLITDGGPADILGALSTDGGLSWALDQQPLLPDGHDPAIARIGAQYHMYTSYLARNLIHLVSDDGFSFRSVAWVELYDAAGTYYEEFGDVDVMSFGGSDFATADLRLFGSGKLCGSTTGLRGQAIMVRAQAAS